MAHRTYYLPLRRQPELSQHFARDTVARLIAARLPAHPRLVIEAGAGAGEITQALAGRGFHILAIEKDPALFRMLTSRFAGISNVDYRLGDFLEFPMPREPYAVVSNVPFGITAALVGKLLSAPRPPDHALLVVQREAAQRFAGDPRQTRIALLHRPWFDITIEHAFRRDDFMPAPSVDCALIRLARRTRPLVHPSLRGE
ncbi:MAG: rRNA adenine N(6)-methyltransferase family protein [Chloroflexi bacterium]|nr:rRNA adenine N(6)-methyltransferase family protein [Chloroflexota bacterium]